MTTVTAASRALIETHLNVVGYHVSEMLMRVPAQVTRDDLASAGYLALTRAAISYDPSQGVPFNRYAAIRIKGALIDELRSMDWLSRGTRRKIREYTKTVEQITTALGREPKKEEIAAALGVDVSEVEAIVEHASVKVLSVDAYDGGLADVLPAQTISPLGSVLKDERYKYLRVAVKALPERLRFVVEQVFFNEVPVAEVALELGVTQSRVSQIRSEAMALLRDGMNTHLDPDLAPVEKTSGVTSRRRAQYFEEIGLRAKEPGRLDSQDLAAIYAVAQPNSRAQLNPNGKLAAAHSA